MDAIDVKKYKNDAFDFLRQLIQIPSVNGEHNEGAIVDLIAQKASELGLDFVIHEKEKGRPNIYIGQKNLFTSNKELLLVAHSDTVPTGDRKAWDYDPFGGEIIDEKLYGRGTLDCKGGIAINIYALKALYDAGYQNKVKIVIGVDEESGADSPFGLRFMLEQGLNARACVYTYGGKLQIALTIGRRGGLRVWVHCKGEAAHSGSKEWQNGTKGASALSALVKFINEVESLRFETDKIEYFPGYNTKLTPTLMDAGSNESLVPDTAKVLLDIRTMPGQDNLEIVAQLKNIAAKYKTDKITFDIEIKNNVAAVLTNPKSQFVLEAAKLMREVYKFDDQTKLKGSGPYNESYMLIKSGIPTIVGFGLQGEGFHSKNEYAEVKSLEQSLEFLTKLALLERF